MKLRFGFTVLLLFTLIHSDFISPLSVLSSPIHSFILSHKSQDTSIHYFCILLFKKSLNVVVFFVFFFVVVLLLLFFFFFFFFFFIKRLVL